MIITIDGPAGANRVLVRQPDLQGVSDFRSAVREAIIVLPIDVANEVEFLVKNPQGFPGNHRRRQKRVSHLAVLSLALPSRSAVEHCDASSRRPLTVGRLGLCLAPSVPLL